MIFPKFKTDHFVSIQNPIQLSHFIQPDSTWTSAVFPVFLCSSAIMCLLTHTAPSLLFLKRPDVFLPQELCTCCSLYLKFSSRSPHGLPLYIFAQRSSSQRPSLSTYCHSSRHSFSFLYFSILFAIVWHSLYFHLFIQRLSFLH